MTESGEYVGSELEIFQHATNWKRYGTGTFLKHIDGEVLEVGAGMGAMTPYLAKKMHPKWVCLEPDGKLSSQIQEKVEQKEMPKFCHAVRGTIDDLAIDEKFDTILYLDVIEHIEDDSAELLKATGRLRTGGHLIVLVPAHQFLFSEFDRAIGHFRRYDKAMLSASVPPSLQLSELYYLDSVGLFASLANKCLLHQSQPTHKQIQFWDKVLVPASRVIDRVLLNRIGKSIVGVWKKPRNEFISS